MKKVRLHHLLSFLLFAWMFGCIREEVLLPPIISTLSNSSVTSGELLIINGSNFDPETVAVFLDGAVVAILGNKKVAEVSIIVPLFENQKTTTIYIKTKFGSSNSLTITILPPRPAIVKVTPSRVGVGTVVKLTGTSFSNVNAVNFKSPDKTDPIAGVINKTTATELEVIVPAGLSKDAADITVVSPSGKSDPKSLTVVFPPKIISFTPDHGGTGSVVRLTGEEFADVNIATVGSIKAEIISIKTNAVEIRIPDNATSDVVFVTSVGGSGQTAKPFQIMPKPVVASFDKPSGSPGAELVISGQNFQDAFEVRIGSVRADILSNVSGSLKVKIPTGANSGKVSVSTPIGTGVSLINFIVVGAPLIISFAPTIGTIGTKITLTGLNLLTITSAKIGLINLQINSKTDTQMEVQVLAGSVTGKISAIGLGSSFETIDNFVVAGTPTITSVSPASGVPGSIVTITGTNFVNPADVKFNSGVVAVVTLVTSTQIVCQAPLTATTGKIVVNGALSPSNFVINVKPVITSISPLRGGIDTDVTISGSYLTGVTVKFFNNISTTIVGTPTDSQVKVKVPAGATTGKITVATAFASTVSQSDFEILANPTVTSFSPSSGSKGSSVVITGTNLLNNPNVKFFNNVPAIIKSMTSTQIIVDVPTGALTGKISVKTDASVNPVLSTADFTVIEKPIISSISPAQGPINEKITINGSNLSNPVSVSFDGVLTTSFISTSATKIEVRVPVGVNGSVSRSINMSVNTAADNSGNQAFLLLGTPTVTTLTPDNNPSGWAFLIQGTNLGSIKKVTLDDKVPAIGVNGIDKQAYNYVTTKVPTDVKPPSTVVKTLKLFYTSDDYLPITKSYTVLSAPPPGIFPPPFIVLPPPVAPNYVQADLSNYWTNQNFKSVTGDSVICYNIRGNFNFGTANLNSTGTFCVFQEYYVVNGTIADTRSWNATWNKGIINLAGSTNYSGQVYTGPVPPQLVLQDINGRQLVITMGDDSNGNCQTALPDSGQFECEGSDGN